MNSEHFLSLFFVHLPWLQIAVHVLFWQCLIHIKIYNGKATEKVIFKKSVRVFVPIRSISINLDPYEFEILLHASNDSFIKWKFISKWYNRGREKNKSRCQFASWCSFKFCSECVLKVAFNSSKMPFRLNSIARDHEIAFAKWLRSLSDG